MAEVRRVQPPVLIGDRNDRAVDKQPFGNMRSTDADMAFGENFDFG